MQNLNLYEELLKMREKYRNNPMDDIKLGRPEWLRSDDPMSEIYEKKHALLRGGKIVFAHIIQANTILFGTRPRLDCPADIVFSAEPCFSQHTEILRELAHAIFKYKGRNLDEVPQEWKDIARKITDEYDRSDFTLSKEVDGQQAEYTVISTMIYRNLLPKGKLCGSLLPVFTIQGCKQVLILPKKYWTKKFRKAWVKAIV